MRQRFAINSNAGLFHAPKHGNEGQIDLFVDAEQACFFDVLAQRSGQAPSQVGGLGQRSAEFQVEAAQRDFGQAVRGIRRIQKIRVEF